MLVFKHEKEKLFYMKQKNKKALKKKNLLHKMKQNIEGFCPQIVRISFVFAFVLVFYFLTLQHSVH